MLLAAAHLGLAATCFVAPEAVANFFFPGVRTRHGCWLLVSLAAGRRLQRGCLLLISIGTLSRVRRQVHAQPNMQRLS